MFLLQIVIGAVMMGGMVVIHAIALDRLLILLEWAGPHVYSRFLRLWKIPMLVIGVVGVFAAHIVEIWIWAIFYFFAGAFDTVETALYYATTSFTTVGFGDVVAPQEWRLLGSFQAAIGFLLFGWSTAFIFEIMTKLYKQDEIRKTE